MVDLHNVSQLEVKVTKTKNGLKLERGSQNAVRNAVINAIKESIESTYENVSVYNSINGLMLEIEHDEEGSLFCEVKAIMKTLDTDIVEIQDEYTEKLEKERKRKEKKNVSL